MRIEIIGKNVTITPAMRAYFEKKLKKLEKFVIIDENTPARVLVRTYNTKHKVEVTVYAKLGILRAEVSDYDAYAAMDLAVDKLVGQIRKQKTRLEKRHRDSVTDRLIAEGIDDDGLAPVKIKKIDIAPMSMDEAIMQMELIGHSFYAYLDEDSMEPSIVYHRNDGRYGILNLVSVSESH